MRRSANPSPLVAFRAPSPSLCHAHRVHSAGDLPRPGSAAPPRHGGWLSSRQWLDKARGAYFAGRIHSADLQDPQSKPFAKPRRYPMPPWARGAPRQSRRSCRGGHFRWYSAASSTGRSPAQTKMQNEPNMDRNLKKLSRFYRSASRAFPSRTAFSMSFNP
jgi:hypothetical protein